MIMGVVVVVVAMMMVVVVKVYTYDTAKRKFSERRRFRLFNYFK